MSVQKKSLIGNLNVTKKAVIAKGSHSNEAGELQASSQTVQTLKARGAALQSLKGTYAKTLKSTTFKAKTLKSVG